MRGGGQVSQFDCTSLIWPIIISSKFLRQNSLWIISATNCVAGGIESLACVLPKTITVEGEFYNRSLY